MIQYGLIVIIIVHLHCRSFRRCEALFSLLTFLAVTSTEMGCGVSNIAGTAEGENLFDFSRRNTIVDKPNVSVQIGEGVRKIDSEHRLVFVFGRWKIPSALNCYQLCYCHGCLNLLGELSILVFSLLL